MTWSGAVVSSLVRNPSCSPFLLFEGSPDFGRGRLMTLLITEPLFTLTFKLMLHLHFKNTRL